MFEEVQDSLRKATNCMKKYVDQNRKLIEFKARDKVMLKLTLQIWKKINSKTIHRGRIPKYDDLFEVM